jgi:Icc-related predicted phosphoesterase
MQHVLRRARKESTVKLVITSDTHNRDVEVPDGDILIHCGDGTGRGSTGELIKLNKWFRDKPHKYKLFVPGNHELMFEKAFSYARSLLHEAKVLLDSEITIEGLRFYGSPWQPEFCNWAYNLPRGEEIKKKWDRIPSGLDVLITHCPPHGILDTLPEVINGVPQLTHLGCEELIKAVDRTRPRVHCFGHIHYGYGSFSDGITQFFNASACNEKYEAVNSPHVFDLSVVKRIS